MKNIMDKLAQIEATAPKAPAKKKMLTETSTTKQSKAPNNKPSLKNVFETMSSGQPQIPVIGKQGSSSGYLNIDDNSPSGQALQAMLGSLVGQNKAEVIMPNQQTSTGTATNNTSNNQNSSGSASASGGSTIQTSSTAAQQSQQSMKESSMPEKSINTYLSTTNNDYEVEVFYDFDDNGDVEITGVHDSNTGDDLYDTLSSDDLVKLKSDVEQELSDTQNDAGDHQYELRRDSNLGESVLEGRDEGKPGKNFAKITKKAGKEYGSKEEGERVAGAIRAKLAKQGKLEEKWSGDTELNPAKKDMFKGKTKAELEKQLAALHKSGPHKKGSPEYTKQQELNFAIRAKGGWKKGVKEADIPSTSGVDTKGAGLGAGRSATTLEGKKAKPDFLDFDKDGNKEEPMKKAIKDKKTVKESLGSRIQAARLEGHAHGLRGHPHCGKNYEDMEECRAYHEGYKQGLDECHGMGMYEDSVPATMGGMDDSAMDEGNAFSAGLARTPHGKTFKVAGKTFVDNSYYDSPLDEADFAFEAWGRELSKLINEGKTTANKALNEGITVSISKGIQSAPDSVNINATDAEAEQVLSLIKQAGLGVFGGGDELHASPDEAPRGMSSVASDDNTPDDIDVVGDNDDMLGLMQKLSNIDNSDEHDDGEDSCEECGLPASECECSGDVNETESEDQMTYNMAEDDESDDSSDSSSDSTAPSSGSTAPSSSGSSLTDFVKDHPFITGEIGSALGGPVGGLLGLGASALANSSLGDYKGLLGSLRGDNSSTSSTSSTSTTPTSDDSSSDDSSSSTTGTSSFPSGATSTPSPSPDTYNSSDNSSDDEDDDDEDLEESKELTEWANNAGKNNDEDWEADIEFMTKIISGGLNKPKSTGQTTVPVVATQLDRIADSPKDWATLAGIKKA